MSAEAVAQADRKPRWALGDAALELLPAAGWAGIAVCVLVWRWMQRSDLSVAGAPLALQVVAGVVVVAMLLLLLLAFIASMLTMFAAAVGWISAGFAWIGVPMGFGCAALTYWMSDVDSNHEGFFRDEMWLLFAQLVVLSVVSAAALLVVEREARR